MTDDREDAEALVRRDHSERYASIAEKVDLAMALSHRPCAGGWCDLDSPCPRHDRVTRVVARYLRLRARARR